MRYDPYPDTLEGIPLWQWMEPELDRRFARAMEQAVDARRYGGPAHAAMYEEIAKKIAGEMVRRAGK